MSNQPTAIPVPTNWTDFGHRVWRAFYIGASAALPATIATDITLNGGDLVPEIQHILITIAVAGLNAVFTAIKAGIAQGRGSDPSNGALK